MWAIGKSSNKRIIILIPKKKIQRILISRTDSIGDVVLTLPMAKVLKDAFPKAEIYFLGMDYTWPVIKMCTDIDGFINYNVLQLAKDFDVEDVLKSYKFDCIIHVFPNKEIANLAKKVSIPYRIGTSHRLYHLKTCNVLVNFSRKKSNLHESQLNLKLLKPLIKKIDYNLNEISRLYKIHADFNLKNLHYDLIDKTRFNIILHPKSKGSAREWGVDNFNKLIDLLPDDKFKIFVTGVESEGEAIRHDLLEPQKHRIVNLTGKLSLEELIMFIKASDGLLAASTGPLHIAAALDKHALGIFSPMKPIHPGRWQPIGKHVKVFVKKIKCNDCKNTTDCHCIKSITPEEVAEYLLNLYHNKAQNI